jgi:DNA-directed RNA polymerase specialized sigma24 family protein
LHINGRQNMKKIRNLTPKEAKVVDALITGKSYKRAAQISGIKEGTLRSIVYRVRQRYFHAKEFSRLIESKQREIGFRSKRYLTG